jgi:hypothetical protein
MPSMKPSRPGGGLAAGPATTSAKKVTTHINLETARGGTEPIKTGQPRYASQRCNIGQFLLASVGDPIEDEIKTVRWGIANVTSGN